MYILASKLNLVSECKLFFNQHQQHTLHCLNIQEGVLAWREKRGRLGIGINISKDPKARLCLM